MNVYKKLTNKNGIFFAFLHPVFKPFGSAYVLKHHSSMSLGHLSEILKPLLIFVVAAFDGKQKLFARRAAQWSKPAVC